MPSVSPGGLPRRCVSDFNPSQFLSLILFAGRPRRIYQIRSVIERYRARKDRSLPQLRHDRITELRLRHL